MALSWMERIQHFFGKTPQPTNEYYTADGPPQRQFRKITLEEVNAIEVVEVKPELTEIEKIHAKFNPKTDMIVMSSERAGHLTDDERNWLSSLGNSVYYFDDDSLVNIAIIKSW